MIVSSESLMSRPGKGAMRHSQQSAQCAADAVEHFVIEFRSACWRLLMPDTFRKDTFMLHDNTHCGHPALAMVTRFNEL